MTSNFIQLSLTGETVAVTVTFEPISPEDTACALATSMTCATSGSWPDVVADASDVVVVDDSDELEHPARRRAARRTTNSERVHSGVRRETGKSENDEG